MHQVLVVDKNKNALKPCQPTRARELLIKGKATVLCHDPFTIILKYEVKSCEWVRSDDPDISK
jgi:hypothetical protein